jgi:hypothetical protein
MSWIQWTCETLTANGQEITLGCPAIYTRDAAPFVAWRTRRC